LFQRGDDGRVRLRTTVLVFDGQQVLVSCRHCGQDVPLDLQVGEQLARALGPRLVLRG